jgi:hypothetical protein
MRVVTGRGSYCKEKTNGKLSLETQQNVPEFVLAKMLSEYSLRISQKIRNTPVRAEDVHQKCL